MEVQQLETATKSTIAALGAAITFLYGGWDALIIALVAFVAFDYITGIAAAAVQGKLSSGAGLKGIARKMFIFVVVALGHIVDVTLGNENTLIRDAIIYFYLANELLSILENGGKLGAPIPPVIKQAVEVLKGRSGGK
ncbi:holin family protein [Paenibacillus sp. GCM10027627]|uniref:phage holin family protein n=1 Tax=unclassified Paenibacillus TaxID=185978 RepID=UPI00363F481A